MAAAETKPEFARTVGFADCRTWSIARLPILGRPLLLPFNIYGAEGNLEIGVCLKWIPINIVCRLWRRGELNRMRLAV